MLQAKRRYASNSAEIKTIDYPLATANGGVGYDGSKASTTATMVCLNLSQEGPSFYNRIGRKIMLKSLKLQLSISPSGTGNNQREFVRAMIVYDRQANGAFPSLSDIIQGYDTAGATYTTATPWISQNLNNTFRFTILRDYRWQLPNNQNNATSAQAVGVCTDYCNERQAVNDFIKLKNLETHYKANAGAIGDISTGALLLIWFGDNSSVNAGFIITYSARLRFYDHH